MTRFKDDQLERLERSGWNARNSIRAAVEGAGLAVPDAAYLRRAITPAQWRRAEEAVEQLTERFATERFGDEVVFGVLLVPDSDKLDTRRPVDPAVRVDQLGKPTEDFFDERLPGGTVVTEPGRDWTPFATVTGTAGVSMGSYEDVAKADCTVADFDTRRLMVRQLWGARVLQCGATLPDSNARERWTFTLMCGEPLVDGEAESGTVLHNRVRFRLGRADRRIGSARVCPAIPLS